MAKQVIPAKTRQAIRSARSMIEAAFKADGNEAETRRRVERIFENVMGYRIDHLSREYAISGTGATEHVDFAIQTESGPDAKPVVMVELKRVGVDLANKHLKQVVSYAINAGCEWVLLTNGREWRIYHVEFDQPPVTKLVEQWNLLRDDVATLARKFELISLRKLRRGSLNALWKKTQALVPESLFAALLAPENLRKARTALKKTAGVIVDFDDIINGVKRLLNESAAKTLADMNLSYSRPKRRPRQSAKSGEPSGESAGQVFSKDEETNTDTAGTTVSGQTENPE